MFKQGGFDCVIGNPPYGAALGSEEKQYFSRAYTCQSYQLDSYLLFLEKAVASLLRELGLCGYIIPNPWLTNLKQQATRKFLCANSSIRQIVHFYFPVFKDAVVDTEILILGYPMVKDNSIKIVFSESVSPEGSLKITDGPSHSQQDWLLLNGEVINIFLTSEDRALFTRIRKLSRSLDSWFTINVGIKPYQVGKGSPPQNKEHVKSRPFDSTVKIDASYRELLRGRDIDRFVIQPTEERYLKYGSWLAEPRPAANFDANEKLLVRQTGDRPIAAIDNQQRLAMNNLHVLAPMPGNAEKLSFILGIVNSRLLTWFYRCMNPEAGEALAEVKRQNVAELPIRPIDFTNSSDVEKHDRMVSLVDRMLALVPKRRAEANPQAAAQLDAQIAATDRQIDRLVYELYELTQEEITLVEGA
ncbi:MAG: Eco57I restriction-modification methylase domain-containing protein [Verrucomicrobia bacterium]|nr:Eco57I restriction-modification methylase domain-containing protein [Verrucomicrobiota bacterium]